MAWGSGALAWGGPMLLLPGAALGIKQAFSAYPPSSFEFPGTFEHVCVQRGLPPADDVQLIFASPPDTETPAQGVRGRRGQRSKKPPLEVSLEHALRSGSMLRSRHVATVKVLQSRSVYASINHILQNASEMTDVRILGGTAFMMRTPCESMADNYYNALTEEGPLLSRVLEAWRAAEGYVLLSKTSLRWLRPAGPSGALCTHSSAPDHASEASARLGPSALAGHTSPVHDICPMAPTMQARRV